MSVRLDFFSQKKTCTFCYNHFMYKRGMFGDKEFLVIGVKKNTDGYYLKFIDQDPNNKNGKVVGKVFIPTGQAKIVAKGLLGKIKPEDIEK